MIAIAKASQVKNSIKGAAQTMHKFAIKMLDSNFKMWDISPKRLHRKSIIIRC